MLIFIAIQGIFQSIILVGFLIFGPKILGIKSDKDFDSEDYEEMIKQNISQDTEEIANSIIAKIVGKEM